MTTGHERASWLIDKARCEEERLTEWEIDFIYDIWERLERAEERGREYELSDKQMEVLERIGEKVS